MCPVPLSTSDSSVSPSVPLATHTHLHTPNSGVSLDDCTFPPIGSPTNATASSLFSPSPRRPGRHHSSSDDHTSFSTSAAAALPTQPAMATPPERQQPPINPKARFRHMGGLQHSQSSPALSVTSRSPVLEEEFASVERMGLPEVRWIGGLVALSIGRSIEWLVDRCS